MWGSQIGLVECLEINAVRCLTWWLPVSLFLHVWGGLYSFRRSGLTSRLWSVWSQRFLGLWLFCIWECLHRFPSGASLIQYPKCKMLWNLEYFEVLTQCQNVSNFGTVLDWEFQAMGAQSDDSFLLHWSGSIGKFETRKWRDSSVVMTAWCTNMGTRVWIPANMFKDEHGSVIVWNLRVDGGRDKLHWDFLIFCLA